MNNELMLDVGQANELKLAFRREGNWDNEKIKALTERRGFLTQVLDVLEGRSQIFVLDPENIIVDYGMSLEDMIKAGRYDWINSDLTVEHFPIKGEGRVEFEAKLFSFDHIISSEDAKALIEEEGWEVAKTEHLLAFGAKNPKERWRYRIMALGSSGELLGGRLVPSLGWGDSEGSLDLLWWGNGWTSNCRFLAVRKVVKN